jgi:hypothetical protein
VAIVVSTKTHGTQKYFMKSFVHKVKAVRCIYSSFYPLSSIHVSTAVKYSRDSHTQNLRAVPLSLHFSPTDFGEQKADVTGSDIKQRVSRSMQVPEMQFTSAKSALPPCAQRKLQPTRALQKAVHRRALIELGF